MIDRRPTATTPRTVVEHTHDLLAATPHAKMPAPRCHEHPARPDNHAVGRLHDPHSRHPGEPFGKAGRELGRNVLHDEDRHRKIGGQEWNHRPQGRGATGGRTDHDGIEASGRGGPGPPRWRRQRRGHRRRPDALPYGGQLLGEFSLDDLPRGVQIEAGGLEDEVEGPLHQGCDRRRCSLGGEAAHHDRPRRQSALFECPQHLDPVPPRHLHIERDHVGPDPRDEVYRRVAVRSRSDDLHPRNPAEDREKHLPVEPGIIDHDNLENACEHGATRDRVG